MRYILKKKIFPYHFLFLPSNILFFYILFVSNIFLISFSKTNNYYLEKAILDKYWFVKRWTYFSNKKIFNCFLKNSNNNLFITVTNYRGDVIFSLSGGKVGLKRKKSKNSLLSLNLLSKHLLLRLKKLKIKLITNLFLTSPDKQLVSSITWKLRGAGVGINNIKYIPPRPHGNINKIRRKKIRRI